jgi:ethanolaminephosphotransferase
MNVYRARASSGQSVLSPLLYLLPFPTTCLIHAAWLASSATSAHFAGIVDSSLLLPFLCSWGLQFAHTVGRMILAHVTKQPYPLWDWMWLWSIVGAFDAALPVIFGT